MSSKDIERTIISQESFSQELLLGQINSLIKARKTIIPFAKNKALFSQKISNENITYLDLANYNAIEEYSPADQVLTVQSGIKIGVLQDFLAKENRCLPIGYSNVETTLLDVLLTGEIGPLENILGGLNRHILGLTSIIGTGELVKSGGKVVKNVSGYDLTHFFIGSYGYFAIPIKANIRLYALPEQFVTIWVSNNDWHKLVEAAKQISNTNIALAYLELFVANLTTMKNKTPEDKFIMALQTYGDEYLIKRAIETVDNILVKTGLTYYIIKNDADQNTILKELNQASPLVCKILDLSINRADLANLLANRLISSFPFIYRINTNRMRFCINSSSDQDILLRELASYANQRKLNLSVVYSDNDHMRKMVHLGYDTKNGGHLSVIKKQLKAQLDPNNLFNPYVDL